MKKPMKVAKDKFERCVIEQKIESAEIDTREMFLIVAGNLTYSSKEQQCCYNTLFKKGLILN